MRSIQEWFAPKYYLGYHQAQDDQGGVLAGFPRQWSGRRRIRRGLQFFFRHLEKTGIEEDLEMATKAVLSAALSLRKLLIVPKN